MNRTAQNLIIATALCAFCFTAKAFKNDPQVLGAWTAVDFVSSTGEFRPGVKSWRGDLFLKEFEFKRGGSTHQPYWSWKKGIVNHVDHDYGAEYVVKAIDGKEYLFLQWINGDVLSGNERPRYYVFMQK